jgi:hypothetical protein
MGRRIGMESSLSSRQPHVFIATVAEPFRIDLARDVSSALGELYAEVGSKIALDRQLCRQPSLDSTLLLFRVFRQHPIVLLPIRIDVREPSNDLQPSLSFAALQQEVRFATCL